MKILVFSDSHGNLSLIKKAMEQHAYNTDLILHLGDNATDARYFQKHYSHIANINFFGNCDYFTHGVDAFDEKVFQLGSTDLYALASHGHNYNVNNNLDILYSKARITKSSIAFYGHTHIADIKERHGIILMNPGSSSLPRGTEPASYGIVTIENNQIMPTVIFDS